MRPEHGECKQTKQPGSKGNNREMLKIEFCGAVFHVQSDDDNLQDVYISTVPGERDKPE